MTALDPRRGALDTSTVILLPRLNDPELLPEDPLITAVTLAELSVGPLVARTDQHPAARQAHLQRLGVELADVPADTRRKFSSDEVGSRGVSARLRG